MKMVKCTMSHVRLTPKRQIVYDTVVQLANHPSAVEIMASLQASGKKLAYATVYNSLRYLTDVGLLQELTVGGTYSRYDARVENHHHVICQACGRVDEVAREIPLPFLRAIEQESGYDIKLADLVIKGVCPACRRQQEM